MSDKDLEATEIDDLEDLDDAAALPVFELDVTALDGMRLG